jgi:hypothetical protein
MLDLRPAPSAGDLAPWCLGPIKPQIAVRTLQALGLNVPTIADCNAQG